MTQMPPLCPAAGDGSESDRESTRRSALLDILPAEMKDANRWLVWKTVHRPNGTAKPIKVPYYVNGCARGQTDTELDQANLASLGQAIEACRGGSYSGLAFALGPDGSGSYWQGVDLDDVPDTEMQKAMDSLPGYVEVSPSGTGIHAIGYGRPFQSLGSNDSGIEAYAGGRFFTVTGTNGKGIPVCLANFVQQTLSPAHSNSQLRCGGAAANVSPVVLPPETITDLRSALRHMRADDYQLWIAMGQACSELGDVGRGLWLDWSSTSKKFDPKEAPRKWETFRGDRTGHQAVFAEAQRRGWTNPRSNAARGHRQTGLASDSTSDWRVSVSDIYTNPAPRPEFLIGELVPAGEVTLLSGHGGSGKSQLELQAAVCVAMGIPFLGKPVIQGPVIFFSGEDSADILRFRLRRICEAMEVDPEQLAKQLIVLDATGDPVLFAQSSAQWQSGAPTDIYHRLLQEVESTGVRIIFIDNASVAFAGDEIKRLQVQTFIRHLRALAKPTRAAVVLAAHVSKQSATGKGGGEDYSGSSQWHNGVRSRLVLEHDKRTHQLVLKHPKSNYGRLSEDIHLGWNSDGILGVLAPGQVLANGLIDQANLQAILDVMRTLLDRGTNIPAATSGPRTIYHVLSPQPGFPAQLRRKELNRLVEFGKSEGKIREETYRTADRKEARRLVLT